MIDEKKLIEYLETRAEESKREWERFDDHGAFGEYHAFSSVIDYVNSMPKSREWIPVSERLPEESLNSVLAWDEYRNRCVFAQYYGGHWYLKDEIIKITAWQPVPEPYRGDTDDSTV